MDSVRRRLDPRRSSLSVASAFLCGSGLHVADQAANFRAGPIPILVTAPLVATLTYVHLRPETGPKRAAVLLGWGFVGSGAAVVGYALYALSTRLPRPMTDAEMMAYDFGLFLWFVASLTAAYAVAARASDRSLRAWVAVLSGPFLQLAWILVTALSIAAGLYG